MLIAGDTGMFIEGDISVNCRRQKCQLKETDVLISGDGSVNCRRQKC